MKKAQVALRLDMLARRWLLNYRRFWLLYISFSFLSRQKEKEPERKKLVAKPLPGRSKVVGLNLTNSLRSNNAKFLTASSFQQQS